MGESKVTHEQGVIRTCRNVAGGVEGRVQLGPAAVSEEPAGVSVSPAITASPQWH